MEYTGLSPYVFKTPEPSKLNGFIELVENDGGKVETAIDSYSSLPDLVKGADALLIAGAYKTGVVYMMQKYAPFFKATLTRQGQATRVNAQGKIVIADANVPRVEYNLETGKPYLLLERASTNNLVHSYNFSNINNGAAYTEVVDVPAPFEGATVRSFIKSTITAGMAYYGGTSGEGYRTISYYAKQPEGGASWFAVVSSFFAVNATTQQQSNITMVCNFNFDTREIIVSTPDGTKGILRDTYGEYQELGDGWFRVAICYDIYNISSGGSTYATIGTYYSMQEIGKPVYVCCPQMENGKLSSYIPTYGAVASRVADELSLTGLQSERILGKLSGTVLTEAVLSDNYDLHLHNLVGSVLRLSNSSLYTDDTAEEITPADVNNKMAIKYEQGESDKLVSKGVVTESAEPNEGDLAIQELRITPTANAVKLLYIALYRDTINDQQLQTVTND